MSPAIKTSSWREYFALGFTTLAVLIVGPAFGLVMLYQTISLFAHLSHANIQMQKHWTIYYPLYLLRHTFIKFIIITFNCTQIRIMVIFFPSGIIFLALLFMRKNMDSLVYGLDTHMNEEDHSSLKVVLNDSISTV